MKIQGKQLADTLRSESTPFDIVYTDRTVGDLNGAVRFTALNNSGSTIGAYKVIYITGSSGNLPTIGLADADTASMPAFGLTTSSSNNGDEVDIVTFGNIKGVDTSTLTVGDILYVSTTAGEYTTTPPTGSGSKLQNIGTVVKADSNGIIKVGGAGRSNATPNLDEGHFFLGNASNQSVESSYQLPITVGTSGQVLASNGTNVTFQDAASGSVSYTSISSDVSVTNFQAVNYQVSYEDTSSGITINLPDTANNYNQAIALDGSEFEIDNRSQYSVTLRIATGSLYVSGQGTYQTWLRHSGNYDQIGIASTTAALTLRIAPMARASIRVDYNGDKRVIYSVTSTGGMIGSFIYNYITASQTVYANNLYVCNGTFTINLPSSTTDLGERIEFKNYGTGTITLDAGVNKGIDAPNDRTKTLSSKSSFTLVRSSIVASGKEVAWLIM